MRDCRYLRASAFFVLLLAGRPIRSQETAPAFNLRVSVDEISLAFHAEDAHGLPVDDLNLDEIRLLDNGKPPRKILAFQSFSNAPVRAGILIDTSQSMQEYLSRNRAISIEYVQRLLRQQSDQAFVMDFDALAEIMQPWTNDQAALAGGIRHNIPTNRSVHLGGTALLDSVYRACSNQFGRIDNAVSGNFILLFSDGEDNASRASFKQVVDSCQRTNTAVYSFRVDAHEPSSTGPKTLADLASATGGRVFADDDSDAVIYDDLRTIEADLGSQYRLIYRPAELRPDGSFHRIGLLGPDRVDRIIVRSGYYAPTH